MEQAITPIDQALRSHLDQREHERIAIAGGLVRAECRSFQVGGAMLRVVRSGLWGFWRAPQEDSELLNLSKGGLCFRSDVSYRRGQRISLQMLIPETVEDVTLSGTVRWQQDGEYYYDVGVQFAAFGRGAGMNPPELLQWLRQLEAQHRIEPRPPSIG